MADESGPGKVEMQELFRRLRNISANRVCFDCNTKNPTWASVTYGVFICIDCSAVHRSLGVHLSFVRSTQLDTNWTYLQLRNMQLGGNANASAFFSQHNCSTSDAQQKYNSRAAHLYREKLNQIVAKYNKIHGNTTLELEDEHGKSPTEKESDFFKDIHSAQDNLNTLTLDNSTRLTKGIRNGGEDTSANKDGPNVTAALSASSGDSVIRKSTIGQRKQPNKLGGKKVGLGAQKVKADFSEIEKEAHILDQMKEKREEDAKQDAERRAQDEEKQMATMRLAYQDLSKQQKQREEQLKHMDPKKAEQVERLGMGIGVRAGVSHSAVSDMQTFDQETPAYGSNKHNIHRKAESFFDDFEVVESSSSGLSSIGGFSSKKNAADWDFERPSRSKPIEEDIVSRPRQSSSKSSSGSTEVGDEAQKKFGNAKAISSDQFFGGSKDSESERRTNLSRFDGQTSISSADYFGDGAQRNMQQSSGFQNSLQNVDFDDVKDSVRQGVTKVAGKLSNLANGVMSSIQEKYGY